MTISTEKRAEIMGEVRKKKKIAELDHDSQMLGRTTSLSRNTSQQTTIRNKHLAFGFVSAHLLLPSFHGSLEKISTNRLVEA